MNISKEEIQRKEFRDVLLELASNQNLLNENGIRAEIYTRLENLYHARKDEKPFRHFYSDIFSVLTIIQRSPSKGDVNVLGQNLAMIRKKYIPNKNHDPDGYPIDISDSIRKLYDHVSLDIARIMYSVEGDRRTSGEEVIISIHSQIETMRMDINKTTAEQQDLSVSMKKAVEEQKAISIELEKQQRDYIAILGIFASIMLAFVGGIVFSTSVLQNINFVSIYRLVAIVLLIGLILSNTLYGLFYYLNRLIYKHDKFSIIPIFVTNVILFIMLGITLLAWFTGIVELRNLKI